MSGLFITSTQLLLCEVGMNDGSLFSECYKYLQHRQYLMSVGKVYGKALKMSVVTLINYSLVVKGEVFRPGVSNIKLRG